jgi:hypothetical protein
MFKLEDVYVEEVLKRSIINIYEWKHNKKLLVSIFIVD